MQKSEYAPLVEVTRGDIVESTHFGAFAAAFPDGRLLAYAGDPGLVTYPRSSMKPLQALPFMERGGAETFGFNGQEIAIMCASHAGTDQHFQVLEGMHKKIGISESDLACGVHWPSDAETRIAMKIAGREPTPFRHNCSGKQTGMLAYARMRKLETKAYLDPQHPVQVSIRETLAEMVEMKPDEMPLGTDGCSAPVYGIPLRNMALGVAKLADPRRLVENRADACRTITAAMMAYPLMVAGPGKFDTRLMTAAAGKVFSKGGAEGYQIVGVMPGVIRKDSPGLGIAIKISDGDPGGRARSAVVLKMLHDLGVLDESDLEGLAPFGSVPVKNWRGIEVGAIRCVFSMTKTVG